MTQHNLVRQVNSRPAWLADIVLALIASCITVGVSIAHTTRGHDSPVAIALAITGGLGLLARRRFPVGIWIIAVVCTSAAIQFTDGRTAVAITCDVALYTIATHRPRRLAEACCAITVVIFATSIFFTSDFAWGPDIIGPTATLVAAVAFGEAVASRRAYLAATEERARRAEETRDEEARRRVVEERLRIARELHDVIAHHITVISAQAGSASQLLHTDTDGAEAALRHVRQASRSVLEELAGMLHLLRRGDEAGATMPAPNLDALPQLLETFASAGLDIAANISDAGYPLSPTTDLVAYRIVQEALTNAHKYGDGRVELWMEDRNHTLYIHIRNQRVPRPDTPSGGFGVTGMKERASAVRGTVEAKIEDDGAFHVRAHLPMEQETK